MNPYRAPADAGDEIVMAELVPEGRGCLHFVAAMVICQAAVWLIKLVSWALSSD